MPELISTTNTSDMIALGISIVIFSVTVFLVARQAVNFFITVTLLFLATVSGFAIANNRIVREKFQANETAKSVTETIKAAADQAGDATLEQASSRMHQIFEQLVELLSNNSVEETAPPEGTEYQEKLQALLEELKTEKKRLEALE